MRCLGINHKARPLMTTRWLHHIRARLTGYFWMPCPNCGRMFGGHETGGETLFVSYQRGVGLTTCNDNACRTEVEQKNKLTAQREGWWDLSWGDRRESSAPASVAKGE